MIENYVAVNNNGEWLLNLVSTGYVTKYKDSKDGWVGSQESSVLAINGNSYSEYGGATGLGDFMSNNSNIRNLSNEKLGYEGLVLLGDAFQKSGSAIETISGTLAVPTEGATAPGIALGRIMQVRGFGAKSYGNYKLGRKEQIWKDAVTTATMKGGGALFKKMLK